MYNLDLFNIFKMSNEWVYSTKWFDDIHCFVVCQILYFMSVCVPCKVRLIFQHHQCTTKPSHPQVTSFYKKKKRKNWKIFSFHIKFWTISLNYGFMKLFFFNWLSMTLISIEKLALFLLFAGHCYKLSCCQD